MVEHEQEALLVPPRDYGALAQAIGRLLDDPVERKRLGNAARRRQQAEFRFEHTLGLLEALYERIYAEATTGDGTLTRS
jgi:glycosyltransferase involved in cell wall biosynthesis